MDQTLQNRNLENCSLNDHKPRSSLSSVTVHFRYSLSAPKNPFLAGSKPSGLRVLTCRDLGGSQV